MENMTPEVLIIIVTTIVAGVSIVVGTMVPTWVEGKAAEKAIEGMARQPDAAPQLRTRKKPQPQHARPRPAVRRRQPHAPTPKRSWRRRK